MRDDAGAASVLVMLLGALTIAVAGVAVWVAQITVARTQVSAAADLAALAAVRSGSCDEARRVARRNGAGLESCVIDGPDFQVVTVIDMSLFGRSLPVRATARAGY